MTLEAYQSYSANQMYKKYKSEGGTLNFTDWLNREKAKGVYPANVKIQEDINSIINQKDYFSTNEPPQNKPVKEERMKNTILGFPTSTLIIAGVIVVGAIVFTKYYKKK